MGRVPLETPWAVPDTEHRPPVCAPHRTAELLVTTDHAEPGRVARTWFGFSRSPRPLTLACAQPEPPDSPLEDRLTGTRHPTPGTSYFCSFLSMKAKLFFSRLLRCLQVICSPQRMVPPAPLEVLLLNECAPFRKAGFIFPTGLDQGLKIAHSSSNLTPAPVLPTGPHVPPTHTL